MFISKWFSLAVLISLPAAAQFRDLATDDTGSRLWFSSSLRLRGTDQRLYDKLFTVDADGRITLLVQRLPDNPHHLLDRPEVSGDGRTLAYVVHYDCPPGCRPPGLTGVDHAVIAVAGQPDNEITGNIHLSRNGRFVLRDRYVYFGPTGQIELIDLQTGTRRDIPVMNFVHMGGGRQIASNGSALVFSGSLFLIRFDGSFQVLEAINFDPLSNPGTFFSTTRITMDDSANVVVYQSSGGALVVQRPSDSTYSVRTLVSAKEGCTAPVISADGKRVLFLSRANFSGNNVGQLQQAWVIDVEVGRIQQITTDPAGIAEATLSGDGTVVWASTYAGRLLRITVETGVTREIIPQTTVVDSDPLNFPIRVAAGSLARLTGRGLSSQGASSGLPLATELSGVRLLADGTTPLPLLFVSPTELRFQVPWELRSNHGVTLVPTQSPFEDHLGRALRVVDTFLELEHTADGQPALAHDDFHGLVTPVDPARPGEVLHLYLTGLGAVDPPVATRQAAPASPLSFVPARLSAYWAGSVLPAPWLGPQVLFAGLAPGMVGIYQVDIQLPADAPLADLAISIQVGDSVTGVTFPVRAAR